MASLKALKIRIGSVKSTQKITKAMKMVAAAKLRRAQEAAQSGRPYAERLEQVMGSLASRVGGAAGGPLLLSTPTALCRNQRNAQVSNASTFDGDTRTVSPDPTSGASSDSGARPHQRSGSAAATRGMSGAPSTIAASSRSTGIDSNTARSWKIANGTEVEA